MSSLVLNTLKPYDPSTDRLSQDTIYRVLGWPITVLSGIVCPHKVIDPRDRPTTEKQLKDLAYLHRLILIDHELAIDIIESSPWDGVKHFRTLLIDYLGAEDNKYIREVTKT